jgi:hypothetical protein
LGNTSPSRARVVRARLLRARSGALGQELAQRGYRLGWVALAHDDEAGLIVDLRTAPDGDGGQVGVRLHWEPTLDDTGIVALAEAILRQPDDQWNVAFRNVWAT